MITLLLNFIVSILYYNIVMGFIFSMICVKKVPSLMQSICIMTFLRSKIRKMGVLGLILG